jgi:hypothetical protein
MRGSHLREQVKQAIRTHMSIKADAIRNRLTIAIAQETECLDNADRARVLLALSTSISDTLDHLRMEV